MVKFSLVFFWIALFFIGLLSELNLLAQDFPYSVPQAPEFDDRGKHIEPEPADTYAPRKRSKRRSDYTEQDNQTDLRTVRPYAPNGPKSAVAPPKPRPDGPSAGYAARPARNEPGYDFQSSPPTAYAPPPAASRPPQQPIAATQGRPDCSSYPMMIAQASSEAEMRATAQMYLACLLKNGWNMDQARNHVIMTIETTYGAAR
ncbi:MAG: hypothetical protein ACLQPD_32870 [Desulfomonilaceae bacterium]